MRRSRRPRRGDRPDRHRRPRARAHLIEGALRNAGEQLEAAAEILTEEPRHAAGSRRARRGHDAADDARDRRRRRAARTSEQPPVCRAAVKLAKIEAKAKAAQTAADGADRRADAEPCATPSPHAVTEPDARTPSDRTPTPTPSPTLTPGVDETQPTPSPTPEATTPPEPTPCATAEADADAVADAGDRAGADASSRSSPSAPPDAAGAAVDETDDGEPSSVSEDPSETHRRPCHPVSRRDRLRDTLHCRCSASVKRSASSRSSVIVAASAFVGSTSQRRSHRSTSRIAARRDRRACPRADTDAAARRGQPNAAARTATGIDPAAAELHAGRRRADLGDADARVHRRREPQRRRQACRSRILSQEESDPVARTKASR